jgi:hypothetical protein
MKKPANFEPVSNARNVVDRDVAFGPLDTAENHRTWMIPSPVSKICEGSKRMSSVIAPVFLCSWV